MRSPPPRNYSALRYIVWHNSSTRAGFAQGGKDKKFPRAEQSGLRAENVPVNDLYALCREAPGLYKCADGLHLTEEGYRACARQVASCIERYL